MSSRRRFHSAAWIGLATCGILPISRAVSPGVHYLITPDIEIGMRVGWGLNNEAARFFSNVGIGWRF